ncbi:MAG TPA: glycerophosphodiester phosphodiesterase, partial [Thiobacillaceae bacterium]
MQPQRSLPCFRREEACIPAALGFLSNAPGLAILEFEPRQTRGLRVNRHATTEFLSGPASPAAFARPMPALIAHRGAAHDAPENTLAAFRLAWQQGADGVEGDFHLTRDGEIVCIHDPVTLRTAGEPWKVAEATLADLRQLDVGSWKGERWRGTRIPTLREVLATVPAGKRIFIEIKCGPAILPALKHALAESGLQPGQAVVICFDADVVRATKRLLPALKALWLTDFRARNANGVKPTADEILETLEQTGADGVDCRAHAAVDQRFMQALRAAHREVHVWTVDAVAMAERYRQLGADSLTSNRAGWLKRQLLGEPTR